MGNESQGRDLAGGTATMEAKPLNALRGLGRNRMSEGREEQQNLPKVEYNRRISENCFCFRQGQQAIGPIGDRLRGSLAQENIEYPSQDITAIASMVNCADATEFFHEDGQLYIRSWRQETGTGPLLWMVARHNNVQPIAT